MKTDKKLKENREVITRDRGVLFENILFKTSLALFFILVSVQVILVIPNVRERLNLSDKSIGVPLNNDEYLYNQGQITLKLIGEVPDPSVKILVNGDETAAFEALEMAVTVKNGDVIEIDGSESTLGHIIKVQNSSANIDGKSMNATVKVEKNIQKLLKVQVN